MPKKVRCTLLGNALAHLIEAGRYARSGTSRSLVFALTNLGNGVELLLKARLEMQDWKLLFAEGQVPDPDDYAAGRFRSIDFAVAVKRVRKDCGVGIRSGQRKLLMRLRNLRNMATHHSLRVERAAAVSLVVQVYSFSLDFIRDQIEARIADKYERRITRLRSLLGSFSEFVEARKAEIKPKLEAAYGSVLDCPHCLQTALHADGTGSSCEFCGYRGSGRNVAFVWVVYKHRIRRVKYLLEDTYFFSCPSCGLDDTCVVVRHEGESGSPYYHCFECGEGGRYDHCCDCGQLFDPIGSPATRRSRTTVP